MLPKRSKSYILAQNSQDTAMIDKTKAEEYLATKCSVMLHKPPFWRKRLKASDCRGFTLVELIVVVLIIGILVTMALPYFQGYLTVVKCNAAAGDINTIGKSVTAYYLDTNILPATLKTAGVDTLLDPGKRPYEYHILDGVNVPLQDIAMINLNTDFDLYSRGADGVSSPESGLDHPENEDDITRANNGAFVGGRP